jgi:nucleoside-diphosphate-sugar epimerase
VSYGRGVIVVTGSAGFIAGHVLAELTRRAHDVVGVDRLEAPDPFRRTLAWCQSSLDQPSDDAMSLFRDADVVIHLAGCPGVRTTDTDIARRRHRDNVIATAVVLEQCAPDAALVIASSSSVYGRGRRGRASREDDRLHPLGGYATSKRTVERMASRRAGTMVVRPFSVIGEGQRPDMALAMWTDAIRAQQPVRILGSPSRTRDFTDVGDVARALVDLVEVNASGVVNVGSGRPQAIGDLLSAVEAACGLTARCQIEPRTSVEPDTTWADTRRLQSLIGWTPNTDLRAIAARFVAARDATLRVNEVAGVGADVA